MLAVFGQHLGDTHLPFVRERVTATVPAALAPWILTALHHAHWGVDLFFVLSGFTLAQPLLARLAHGGDSPWRAAFFRRRAARLYPAYLAALALVIAAVPAVRKSPSFPASLAAHLAMLQGLYLPGGLAIIGAAWSLTTEVCFYLVWPLLGPRVLAAPLSRAETAAEPLTAARPGYRSSWRPWALGAALVVAVWLVRAVLHDIALDPGAPQWLLEATQRRWAICRLDQFLLGAMAAALHARMTPAPTAEQERKTGLRTALLCAPALLPIFYLEGAFYYRPFGAWPYPLLSLATAGLVLGAASTTGRAARWLFPRPLRALGVISYGVFLNHQLAIGAAARLAGPPGSWGSLGCHAALALGLSILLGWASWALIERPIIERAAASTGSKMRAPR